MGNKSSENFQRYIDKKKLYKGKKILGLITARGGSKGIPRKNLAILGNKPMLNWTIDEAQKSKYLDRLIISSEDDEIVNIAKKSSCEVPFIRPVELAQDRTSSMQVILHAINEIEAYDQFDYLLLLQPTSPFRKVTSIDKAIKVCIDNEYQMIVSVGQSKKSPNHMYYKGEDKKLIPVLGKFEMNSRRQDQKKVFEHNGAIYMSEIAFLKEKTTFNCPEARGFEMYGYENFDIDTPDDLTLARILIDQNLI